jgi:hypothetical protein
LRSPASGAALLARWVRGRRGWRRRWLLLLVVSEELEERRVLRLLLLLLSQHELHQLRELLVARFCSGGCCVRLRCGRGRDRRHRRRSRR